MGRALVSKTKGSAFNSPRPRQVIQQCSQGVEGSGLQIRLGHHTPVRIWSLLPSFAPVTQLDRVPVF